MNILLFGGTSEGNRIAQWLADQRACQVTVCSATEYGGSLVPQSRFIHSLPGRMNVSDMRSLIEQEKFACIIDATHPYANIASENIKEAATQSGAPLVRVIRESEPDGPWIKAKDAVEAAQIAANLEGNILLTTGAKELSVYAQNIPHFAERVFARVLSVEGSVSAARDLGLCPSHIIAMQGPFSQSLNEAMIDEFNIKVMVTKASGSTGGFWEKVNAANNRGTAIIVIHRPVKHEEGLTVDEACDELKNILGL